MSGVVPYTTICSRINEEIKEDWTKYMSRKVKRLCQGRITWIGRWMMAKKGEVMQGSRTVGAGKERFKRKHKGADR